DGATFYVAQMLTGTVHRLRISDLTEVDRFTLGGGFRYLAILPGTERLLVASYTTGEVALYDVPSRRRLGSVVAGPGVPWVDGTPDGRSFLVSPALGLTLFDAGEPARRDPSSVRPTSFPLSVLVPRVVASAWRSERWSWGPGVLLSLVLCAACVRLRASARR